MTMPPLPVQGNTNWHGWASAVHDAATEVVAGRLTEEAQRAAFVPFWKAAEAVTTTTVRVAPDGSTIKSNSARTTRASYDATEQAAWTVVSSGGGGPAAALAPVQLKRAAAGGNWTDAAGAVYDNTARTALRPHPIYWLASPGAEPPWSANTYDANTTYGDIVNVTG